MARRLGVLIARVLDQPLGLTLEQFADPFVPVVAPLSLDTLDMEYPRNITRHAITETSPAVLARFSAAVLFNPATSGVHLEILGVNAFYNPAGIVSACVVGEGVFTSLANDADVSAAIASMNTEYGIAASSMPGQATVTEGDLAALFTQRYDRANCGPALPFQELRNCRAVRLAPRTGIMIQGHTANQSIDYGFAWREVPIAKNAT